jgi:hypothetical protein
MTDIHFHESPDEHERGLKELCDPANWPRDPVMNRLGELLECPTTAEAARDIDEILDRFDTKDKATAASTNAARKRTSLSDAHLFERRLLGRYIEHFERFANTVSLALDRTAQLAEHMQAFVRAAEVLAYQGPREQAVVQCFQNVSWQEGVKRAALTTGEAIMIGPETIDLNFEIEVDGPVEFELRNQGGSFLVMTLIRLGELVRARGSLVRYCEERARKGQLFTVTCSKPKFSTTVQERKP